MQVTVVNTGKLREVGSSFKMISNGIVDTIDFSSVFYINENAVASLVGKRKLTDCKIVHELQNESALYIIKEFKNRHWVIFDRYSLRHIAKHTSLNDAIKCVGGIDNVYSIITTPSSKIHAIESISSLTDRLIAMHNDYLNNKADDEFKTACRELSRLDTMWFRMIPKIEIKEMYLSFCEVSEGFKSKDVRVIKTQIREIIHKILDL